MFWRWIHAAWRSHLKCKLAIFCIIFLTAVIFSMLLSITIHMNRLRENMQAESNTLMIDLTGQTTYSTCADLTEMDMKFSLYPLEVNLEPLMKLLTVTWKNNFITISPFLRGNLDYKNHELYIVGTAFQLGSFSRSELENGECFPRTPMHPYWRMVGKWPEPDQYQAVIGSKLVKAYGWKVGETVPLGLPDESIEVTITGLLQNKNLDASAFIVPTFLAERLLKKANEMNGVRIALSSTLHLSGNRQGNRSSSTAHPLLEFDKKEYAAWYHTTYVSQFLRQLEQIFPGASAEVIGSSAGIEISVLTNIKLLLLVIAFLIIPCVSILTLAPVLKMMQRFDKKVESLFSERGPQALAKARRYLYIETCSQSGLSSIIGSFIGTQLTIGIGNRFFELKPIPNVQLFLYVLIVSELITFIAVWLSQAEPQGQSRE